MTQLKKASIASLIAIAPLCGCIVAAGILLGTTTGQIAWHCLVAAFVAAVTVLQSVVDYDKGTKFSPLFFPLSIGAIWLLIGAYIRITGSPDVNPLHWAGIAALSCFVVVTIFSCVLKGSTADSNGTKQPT